MKKAGSKIRFIIPAVMLILGIACMTASAVIRSRPVPEGRIMDHTNVDTFQEGDLVTVLVQAENLMELSDGNYYAEFYNEDFGYEYSFVIKNYSANTGFLDRTIDDYYNQKVTGKLYLLSDEEENAAVDRVCPYYDYCRDKFPDIYIPTEATIRENLTYGIDVTTEVNTTVISIAGIALTVIGALVLLIMLLRLRLSRSKTALAVACLALAGILVIYLIIRPAIQTVMSVKKDGEGIYSMDYKADYKLGKYIEADIKSIDELVDWGIDNLLYGVSADANRKAFRCSSFAVESPEGAHLVGRNMDYPETDSLIVHTNPKDGYESIAIADLSAMGIGVGGEMNIDDLKARVILLCAPYIVGDGVNEKGLAVTSLSINDEPGTTDTEKHDMLVNVAVRVLLDKCATTDEAVEMLRGFDVYSPVEHGVHLFISDRSGRSVTVEWLGGEMYAVESDQVANFPLYNVDLSKDYDGRYATMVSAMNNKSTFTREEAMQLLDDVSQPDWTRWSAVYDLDNFTVDVCVNEEYDKVYTYSVDYWK